LRPSDIDACAGSVKHLQGIVTQIRQAWPQVRIAIRADSGFCREEILRWCEDNGVDSIIGLAKGPSTDNFHASGSSAVGIRLRATKA
jgi:hypothetical protein